MSTWTCFSYSEGIFVVKNVNNTVPWTYIIIDLSGEDIEHFMKNSHKRQIKENLGL